MKYTLSQIALSPELEQHFEKYRLRFLAQGKTMVGDAYRPHRYLSTTKSPLFR